MSITKNKKKKPSGALKIDILKRVKADSQIIASIIIATKKSYPTVKRWIETNSEMLTTARVLNVICDALNLSWTEVLYKEQVRVNENDQN